MSENWLRWLGNEYSRPEQAVFREVTESVTTKTNEEDQRKLGYRQLGMT